MNQRPVEYAVSGKIFRGMAVLPDAPGKRPGVLVAHDWSGRNDLALKNAERLAQLGYVGFALDMYGDGKVAASDAERVSLMQSCVKDRGQLMARIQGALAAMKALPEVDAGKTGAIGFCFGGLCVLDLARSGAEVGGVVSFHGVLAQPPKALCKPTKAKVLVLHGYSDPMASPDQMVALGTELNELCADWQVHAYGHVVHAFTNPAASDPKTTCFHQSANDRAFRSMRDFFADLFG